ncbi:MAG: glycosyl transferase family 2, partial [Planctomycetales bacterium]|nr:glycosyl transferase family 2 [Planctomycetales bacterium]
IVTGDSPLIQTSSIERLFQEYDRERPACILGTLKKDDPFGLGRIVRTDEGEFLGIVEEKDATDEQRRINEVNMSTYVFDCRELLMALEQLRTENNQREYYITDCPGILKSLGKQVAALPVLKPCEALSINTFDDLAAVEAEMRKLGYLCES